MFPARWITENTIWWLAGNQLMEKRSLKSLVFKLEMLDFNDSLHLNFITVFGNNSSSEEITKPNTVRY